MRELRPGVEGDWSKVTQPGGEPRPLIPGSGSAHVVLWSQRLDKDQALSLRRLKRSSLHQSITRGDFRDQPAHPVSQFHRSENGGDEKGNDVPEMTRIQCQPKQFPDQIKAIVRS